MKPSFHESFEREEHVAGSSDRGFGFVFAAVFTIIGLWPLLGGSTPYWWALGVSALFLLASLARPALLAPLNRLWTRFGLLLHKITNPIIMGFLFFFLITPFGLVRRVVRRDPLGLKRREDLESYWSEREAAQSETSMERQF